MTDEHTESKRTFEWNGGIALIQWPQHQVGVRIDRLREDSSYNLTGEILVRTSAPGSLPHLHQARLNLTSTTARKTVANLLGERMAGLDWFRIIEEACILTIRKYREGEPPLKVKDIPKHERLRHRLQPLLLDRMPNMIFGRGGLGKSLLATYFAVLIERGYGTGKLMPEQGNVLYLDYEASSEEFGQRVRQIEAGLEMDGDSGILYRFCHQPLVAEVEEIQGIVSEHDIGFIVVDSVGPACGGEPELAEMVIKYYTALRSLRCTSLSIAHVSRQGGGERGPFGSVYWINLARSVWEVKKEQEIGEDQIHVGLYHQKINYGRLLRPMGLRIDFVGNEEETKEIKFHPIEVSDVPGLAIHLPLRERIKAELKGGMTEFSELVETLGEKGDVIRARLHEGKDRGEFFQKGTSWGLAVREPSPSKN